MTPHTKSWNWLNGEDMCTECNEDWPCRDMRMWQSGYHTGLKEIASQLDKHIILRGNDQWQERLALLGFKEWLDAKLKEQP